MKKKFNLESNNLLYSILLLVFFSPDAYAYIDPGTGSLVIQAIIAIIAGAGIFISQVRMKISSFFRSIMKRIKGETEDSSEKNSEQTKE